METMRPLVQIDDEVREMNDAEFAEYEAAQLKAEEEKAALLEKEAAKAALYERLGITAEEAALLLA